MSEKMAFGPYLKKIEDICRPLSREELQEIIMGMAREARVHERNSFIEKIKTCLPGGHSHPKSDKGTTEEDILEGIEALKESILERIELIENGEYHELEDFDDYDPYDYEPEVISQEQLEELSDCLDVSGQYFVGGRLEKAEKIYEAVFALVEETDIEHFLHVMNTLEARARYCRCVYELTPGPQRINALLKVMNPDMSDSALISSRKNYPMLEDVMDTLVKPMSDFEQFLPEWEAAVSQTAVPGDRRARLVLEAVGLRNDLEKISALARTWADKQPLGYICWLKHLETKELWEEVCVVAREALSRLNHGKHRAKTAGYLVQAGEKLESNELALEGKRETFFSIPSHTSLIQLVKEAKKQNKREAELGRAIDHLSAAVRSDSHDKVLLVKTLLMAGRIKNAFSFARDVDKVGWSYQNHGGVMFSSILYLAGRMNEDCLVTDSLLEGYAEDDFSDMYDNDFPDDFDVEMQCSQEIKHGLAISSITDGELEIYFKWAVDIGEKRIRHIVSNKYRKAYNRAAQVLVALAETFAARDENAEASAILKKYYYKLFNRFAAFRGEVRVVLSMSDILENKRIGV